jgi:hypothetical protein
VADGALPSRECLRPTELAESLLSFALWLFAWDGMTSEVWTSRAVLNRPVLLRQQAIFHSIFTWLTFR